MKKTEFLAFLCALMVILSQLAHLVIRQLSMAQLLGDNEQTPIHLIHATTYVLVARSLIILAVHIALAGWVTRFVSGRTERPLLWGGFAFLFGLVAPVVFIFAEMVALKWAPGRRVAS
jgi:hypothetical protein